ncbi:unnamed protein product [Sphagnum balticum]
MGLPTRAIGLARKPLFVVAALALPLLCHGIALHPPMGVCQGKFPTGMLALVGQGCTIGIRQIDHHNIGIGSDTVVDAVFIFGFVTGASHLHCQSLSKLSKTQSSLSSNFEVRTDFRSPKPGCEDRTIEVPLH